jgi:hypothetical protein
MMENEDSVVTSLNELRKLKHDRISRQTQSRSVVGTARTAVLAEDPASDQVTPAPVQGLSSIGAHHAPAFAVQPSVAPGPSVGFTLPAPAPAPRPAFAMPASAGYESPHMQATQIIQTKTSYTAAAIVAVLLLGVGGAGYMKLQSDTKAQLESKDMKIKQAEADRMKSVELAARADKEARTNLRQCEDKLKVATAAPATPAASPTTPTTMTAAVSPPVEKKAEKKAAKVARASHKAAKPAKSVAQAEPVEKPSKAAKSSSADIPTIAKKKKLDNDPLAGLGKL